MPVYLYDALYPAGIPIDIEPDAIVASYIDHPEVVPPCMTQLAIRFPSRTRVGISAHGHPAAILDCESGAILPMAVPAIVSSSRTAGFQVAVYASPANWSLTQQACSAAGIALPLWWAVIRALGPVIPAGAVGNQFLGAGPYDKSIITDEWAGILMSQPDPGAIFNDVWTPPMPATGKPTADAGSPVFWYVADLWRQISALTAAVAALQAPAGSTGLSGTAAVTGTLTLTQPSS